MEEAGAGQVVLRVLGPLEVEVGGCRVQLPSRLERSALAALAVRAGRPVPVEFLAGALWGDELPPSWRKSIHVRVSRLRQRLESAGVPDARDVIATEPAGYSLRTDGVAVDADRFEQLLDAGRARLREGAPSDAEDLLARALDLWRGEPVPELSDTATGLAEAARLEELRQSAIEERIDAALDAGREADAVAWAEAAVVDEPLRERRWGQLMVALYRDGRQAEALRAYQRARDVLVRELGIEPSPTLVRMEAEILAQDPGLSRDPTAPAGSGAPPVASLLGWAERQCDLPLVGRATERNRLFDAWRAVRRRGQAGAVAVVGPAGIGKSRLAAELALAADAEGALVLVGRAIPGVDLSLFAETAAALGEPVPAGSGGGVPLEWAARVYERLADEAARRPLVLVLDDLQWADAVTMTLLRGWFDQRLPVELPWTVLVLALVRDGRARPHGLAELLSDLRRLAVHDRIDVGRLDGPESVRLLAGASRATTDLTPLAEEAGGVPGHLVALGAHLRHGGALDDDGRWQLDGPPDLDTVALPGALVATVEDRARALPEEVQAFLAAVAVVGWLFDVDEAAAVGELGDEEALELLSVAAEDGFVEELRETPGRYRFASEVERRVLAARLPSARRSRVEARLAGHRIPWP